MRHRKDSQLLQSDVKSSRQMSEDIPQSSRKIIRVTWNTQKEFQDLDIYIVIFTRANYGSVTQDQILIH